MHTSHCGSTHAHVITCLSVSLSVLVLSSSSPLSRFHFLSHCQPVLCPAHQLPCRRNRRGLKPLHSRTNRSIAPWRCTTFSHLVLSLHVTLLMVRLSSRSVQRKRHWNILCPAPKAGMATRTHRALRSSSTTLWRDTRCTLRVDLPIRLVEEHGTTKQLSMLKLCRLSTAILAFSHLPQSIRRPLYHGDSANAVSSIIIITKKSGRARISSLVRKEHSVRKEHCGRKDDEVPTLELRVSACVEIRACRSSHGCRTKRNPSVKS